MGEVVKFYIYGCRHCEEKRVKWDKKKVNEWLAEHGEGTILKSNFTTSKNNLEFECSCGNTFVRTWDKVKGRKNVKCEECNGRILWSKEKINEWLAEHGEGTVLLDEYINTKTPITFKCSCGEKFTRAWSNVKLQRQIKCNTCNGVNHWDKESINEWLAKNGDGTVLLDEYTNNKEQLTFQCSCGEKFVKSWFNIQIKGNFKCETCSDNKISWTTEKCKAWLAEYGEGTILESEYAANHKPLEFKCSCGEKFIRTWTNVKDRKCLKCNTCSGLTYWNKEKCNEWLSKHGKGTIMVGEYINTKTPITFKCSCGEKFVRTWDAVKNMKLPKCEICTGKTSWNKEKVNDWLAQNSDGTVLESEYTNNRDELIFTCSCGEKFTRRWHDVKDKYMVKCGSCNPNLSHGEELTANILNELQINYIFQETFDDLVDENNLQVDFYITDERYINTKIEINGEFHFKPYRKGDTEALNLQQKHDEMKRKHSKKHGHGHIEINYFVEGYVKLENGTVIKGVKKGDKETLKRVIVAELEKYRIEEQVS